MKKIYSLLAAVSFSGSAVAQCLPDPNVTGSGIFPPAGSTIDTAYIRLPDAAENVAYSAVIQLGIPADTTLEISGFPIVAPIDSMRLENVAGMPSGLTYVCDNGPCTWSGGTTGCVELYGTPVQWGDFDLDVVVRAYVNLGLFGDTNGVGILDFKLLVTSPQSVAEQDAKSWTFGPNPSTGVVNLFLGSGPNTAVYRLMNVQGQWVASGTLETSSTGEATLDFSQMASGLYSLSVEVDGKQSVQKLFLNTAIGH